MSTLERVTAALFAQSANEERFGTGTGSWYSYWYPFAGLALSFGDKSDACPSS